jgi:hypothetical protein
MYSHLRHDLFAEKAFDAVKVDLARPAGDVVSISPSLGENDERMARSTASVEPKNLAQVSVS